MLPFKPNKRYTSIAIYAAVTIAITTLLGSVLFHLTEVGAFFGSLFSVLSPLLYGLIFAYLLRPLVKLFEKLFFKLFGVSKRAEDARIHAENASRVLAITLSFLLVFAFVFCFIFFLLPLLLGDSAQFGANLLELATNSVGIINQVIGIFGVAPLSSSDITNFITSSGDAILSALASFGASFVVTMFDMTVGLCLSAGILYHRSIILAHARRFGASLFSTRVFRYLHRIADYSDRVFGKYLVGKIIECLLIGLLYLIVLPIIGVPYPFLITVIMTITNFIPVIGAYIGGLPSGILILTEVFRAGSDTSIFMVLWFAVIVLAVEQIDGNIIAPKVIGSIIGLRAVWIMVAVAVFGGLFGMIGMFLSAPIFSIIYMLVRDATNHRLAKRGQSSQTEDYTEVFASTASHKKRSLKHLFFFGLHEKQDDEHTKK